MIDNYFKNCAKTTSGNHHKFFAARISDIDDITISGDTTVTAISMDGLSLFAQANADIDTVGFTSTLTGKSRQFNACEFVARFSKKTEQLMKFKNQLSDGVVCGLVIIRVDNDKNVFISGINKDVMFSRPYDEIEANFNAGTSVEDIEEGNSYMITLRRNSPDEEYKLDSTLAASVLAGTAPFISWE